MCSIQAERVLGESLECAVYSMANDVSKSFGQRLWIKVGPRLESFLIDMFGYSTMFIGLLLVFFFFRLLRRIGFPGWVLDAMEIAENVATVVIFAAFLTSLVRRAFLELLRRDS